MEKLPNYDDWKLRAPEDDRDAEEREAWDAYWEEADRAYSSWKEDGCG